MGGEGADQGVTRLVRVDYKPERAASGAVYHVHIGDRLFMVVVGFSKTLVFERYKRPDLFVMCREVDCEMDPEMAVTGTVLGQRQQICHDPVVELQRRLDAREKAYWALHNENQRLRFRSSLKGPKKKRGGKRGRRNP